MNMNKETFDTVFLPYNINKSGMISVQQLRRILSFDLGL